MAIAVSNSLENIHFSASLLSVRSPPLTEGSSPTVTPASSSLSFENFESLMPFGCVATQILVLVPRVYSPYDSSQSVLVWISKQHCLRLTVPWFIHFLLQLPNFGLPSHNLLISHFISTYFYTLSSDTSINCSHHFLASKTSSVLHNDAFFFFFFSSSFSQHLMLSDRSLSLYLTFRCFSPHTH